MPRIKLNLLLFLCLTGLACRPSQPIAPTPSSLPPTASPPAAVTTAPPTSSTPSASPPIAKPPASAPPVTSSTDAPLRDLAARLLESDGQGGWKKNSVAIAELEALGPEAVEKLLPLLNDQTPEVRRGAAFYLLGQFNQANPDHVSGFTGLLDNPDRTIRSFAQSALKQMRRQDQIDALPRVLAMLSPETETNAEARASIARFCASLKSDAATTAPQLIAAAASDPAASVRGACLIAIREVAPPEQAAAPLAKGLTDQDAGVRLVAALRLKQLGKAAGPGARELAAALADTDDRIRDAAAATLIEIGAPAAEPLAAQLASPSVQARKYSLACLAKIGPAAKSALPAIEKCKQDPDPEVRKLAEAAAKQIGGK